MNIKRHDSGDILSTAVEYNGIVFLCGMVADNLDADIKGQTEDCLKQIDEALAMCGTDKTKLLSATVYITDISQKPKMNEAWTAWLGKNGRPTRACIQVTLASPRELVEIVVSAAK